MYTFYTSIDQDYDTGPFTITFPARTTVVYLNIPTINDNTVEDDENFTLTFNSSTIPEDIFIGDDSEITVTIANDDCKFLYNLHLRLNLGNVSNTHEWKAP